MAKAIKRGSMDFKDEMLGVSKHMVLTAGVSSGDPDVDIDATGLHALVTVPAGTIILGAKSVITEAFTASVTLDIGDSDDDDGLIPTAAVVPTSTGVIMKQCSTAGYFDATGMKKGVYYPSAMTINAKVTTATPVAGKVLLDIEYLLV